MEPSATYEDVEIPLPEPLHGLDHLRGVLGIPEWWPTGERIAIVLAHSATTDHTDALISSLANGLTERSYLTLRFNFPFAEAGKRASSDRPVVLERAYRAALNVLGRDPTARPARLIVGGMGLGGRVAAGLVADRLQADGLFLLGFPLHPQGKPSKSDPDVLFRATAPMLFIQGTRDRRCEPNALRTALRRVGAPMELYDVADADHHFHVPRKSGRTNEEVQAEVFSVLANWIARRLL